MDLDSSRDQAICEVAIGRGSEAWRCFGERCNGDGGDGAFGEPTKSEEGLVGDGVVLVASGGGDLRKYLLLDL